MSASKDNHIGRAAEAHSNLNIFAAVVELMEGGCVYGYQPEASRIIAIAQKAQQRFLREYDREVAAAKNALATPEANHE